MQQGLSPSDFLNAEDFEGDCPKHELFWGFACSKIIRQAGR